MAIFGDVTTKYVDRSHYRRAFPKHVFKSVGDAASFQFARCGTKSIFGSCRLFMFCSFAPLYLVLTFDELAGGQKLLHGKPDDPVEKRVDHDHGKQPRLPATLRTVFFLKFGQTVDEDRS